MMHNTGDIDIDGIDNGGSLGLNEDADADDE